MKTRVLSAIARALGVVIYIDGVARGARVKDVLPPESMTADFC
jgi:hypothetical protein